MILEDDDDEDEDNGFLWVDVNQTPDSPVSFYCVAFPRFEVMCLQAWTQFVEVWGDCLVETGIGFENVGSVRHLWT